MTMGNCEKLRKSRNETIKEVSDDLEFFSFRNPNNENDEDNEVDKPDNLDYSWDMILGPLNRKSKVLGRTANVRDSKLALKNRTNMPKLLYVYDYEK